MKKIKDLVIIISALFLVIFSVFEYQENKNRFLKTEIQDTKIEQQYNDCISTDYQECKEFPWLDLPLKYFAEKDVEWGSISASPSGKHIIYNDSSKTAFDNKAVYQSYPTIKTTINKYSSDVIQLSTKKYSEIRKKLQNEENYYDWKVSNADKNYKDYGQLAVNFLENSKVIEGIDNFDVNGDGIKEKILSLNFVGRADGGSYSSAIVKGNNIIFSVNEDESFIVPADTDNGFYVEWRNPNDESARCCQQGYLRTRFVYENGKFIPVYEQEIRYLIINKDTP